MGPFAKQNLDQFNEDDKKMSVSPNLQVGKLMQQRMISIADINNI